MRLIPGPIAELVLDRPKVNALDAEALRQIAQAFTTVADDPAIRGLLIRAEGRAFSAGLDLKHVMSLDRAGLGAFLTDFDAAFVGAFRCPKPMAAAVSGHAIAGGLVLALAADFFALGEGGYKVGLTELQVGVPFPESALQIVTTALAPKPTRALVYGAGLHSPAEAFAMGVGDALVADAEAAARAWLTRATRRPAATFTLVKARLRAAANAAIDAGPTAGAVAEALLSGDIRAALQGALKR